MSNKNTVDYNEQSGKARTFNNFKLGVVVTVGKVDIDNTGEDTNKRNRRFNADTHAIRVRIAGSDFDKDISKESLSNCFPLLPKHLNIVPKEGEMVMVIMTDENEKLSDRWYMGPIISSEEHLTKDLFEGTATSNLAHGTSEPTREISKLDSAKGVFEDPQNVVIEGRYNTDIIQRPSEILIRAGKFKLELEPTFNSLNPGFIQMKHTLITIPSDDETKLPLIEEGSVTNIVSSKINLLTYKGGSPEFENLTKVNLNSGVAEYINDEQLQVILEEAHPLVFGDTLVEYLQLLRDAFTQHVHNGNGNEPTDRTDRGSLAVEDFLSKAKELEKDMVSKNIRIN